MNVVPKLDTCPPQYLKEHKLLFSADEPKENREFYNHALAGTKFQLDVLDRVLGILRDRTLVKQTPPAEWITAIQSCADAFCALSKLFENEESAYRVLNVAKKTGYVISLDRSYYNDPNPKNQIWTLEEVQGIEKALSFLPPDFYHLKKLQDFRLPNDADSICSRSAGAYFSLYDAIVLCPIGRMDREIFELMLHEIGHAYDFSAVDHNQFNITSGFHDISGWKPSAPRPSRIQGFTENESPSDDSSFVTHYSKTNPREDFAESILFYVNWPRKLAAVSPKKYALIKEKIFKGREYLAPRLQAGLEKALGVDELITKATPMCLSKVSGIGFDESSEEYEMYRPEWRPSQGRKEGYCSVELNPLVQAKLDGMSPSDRCALGDLKDVLSYVNQRLDSVLQEQLTALRFSRPGDEARFKSAYKTGCVSKKDFTARCYFQTLSKVSPNFLGRWKDKKAVQKQVFEDLIRLTESGKPDLQAPAFEKFKFDLKLPWPKAQMYSDCLGAIQEITFPAPMKVIPGAPPVPLPPPGTPFVSVRGESSSQTQLSVYCAELMKKKALSKGYRFDENRVFETMALEKTLEEKPTEYSKNFSSFYSAAHIRPFSTLDDAVFREVSRRSKECVALPADKVSECRTTILREALTSWAKAEGIDSADIVRESFVSELASKIRW